VFAQWSVAVLAALAVDRLNAREAPPRDGVALGAAWGVVLLSAVSVPFLTAAGGMLVNWAGPLVMATAAGLLTLAARGVRVALAALVLLAAGDLALYGLRGAAAWQDFITRDEALGFLDTNRFLPRSDGRLLRGNFPNLYLLGGYRLFDGYVAIPPTKQLDYRQPNALRVAQVEYVHRDFFKGGPPPGAEPRDRGWFRLNNALPRVRLVTEARVSAAPADIASIDVTRMALVTHGLELGGGAPGESRLSADLPGDITVEVAAPTRQLLVVSESYHEGWSATLDDGPVPVERVNADFLGVVVPAGLHRVVMRFRPVHLIVGGYASVIAGALACAGLWPRRRRP
jgi:hypothetical protein